MMFLAIGFGFPNEWRAYAAGYGKPAPPEVLEQMLDCWQRHRDEIESILSEHPDQAGLRCWGWWLFESPEPRDFEIPEADQLARISNQR